MHVWTAKPKQVRKRICTNEHADNGTYSFFVLFVYTVLYYYIFNNL